MTAKLMKAMVAVNVLGLVLLAGGCATTGGESTTPGGATKVVALKRSSKPIVSPQPPAILKPGERVTVTAPYEVEEGQTVTFAVRPFVAGVRARSYLAHPMVKCEPGKGMGEGWFTFQKPTTIDEIRVIITDTVNSKVLSETSIPAALSWE